MPLDIHLNRSVNVYSIFHDTARLSNNKDWQSGAAGAAAYCHCNKCTPHMRTHTHTHTRTDVQRYWLAKLNGLKTHMLAKLIIEYKNSAAGFYLFCKEHENRHQRWLNYKQFAICPITFKISKLIDLNYAPLISCIESSNHPYTIANTGHNRLPDYSAIQLQILITNPQYCFYQMCGNQSI